MRTLRIELRETDDEDADRDRLQRLLALLAEHPGEDTVRLTVRTLDGATQAVALSHLRVSATEELTEALAAVLGPAGNVRENGA